MDQYKLDSILELKKSIEGLKIDLARAEGNNNKPEIAYLKLSISNKEGIIARLEGGENLDRQLMPPPPPPKA